MKKAILFGASGNVGSFLLQELLNSPSYEQVIAVVRRELPLQHPKLKVFISDCYSLPELKQQLTGDHIFIALGATDKVIERHYPVLAAKLAKSNGTKSAFVVTAVGANPQATMAYLRIKGEIEQDMTAMDFDQVHFFRPSMIMGERSHYRSMEKTMMAIWKILDPLLIGPLKKYKGMNAKDIARAIYLVANQPAQSVNVYNWPDMYSLLTTAAR